MREIIIRNAEPEIPSTIPTRREVPLAPNPVTHPLETPGKPLTEPVISPVREPVPVRR